MAEGAPSPPAYVYEVLTLATATGSSALFFVISAVCCIGIGGRTIRARHTSRMDRMPVLPARHGEEFTGPFRPDHQQPGARLAPTSGALSVSGMARWPRGARPSSPGREEAQARARRRRRRAAAASLTLTLTLSPNLKP